MAKSGLESYIVTRPDYIPEGEEHLFPHIGGAFHDFIPEGADGLTVQGYTADADVTPEQRQDAEERKGKARKGAKAAK